jgi:hypothetical protein
MPLQKIDKVLPSMIDVPEYTNWQNTYTDFSAQSANNASVYSTVQSNSAAWGGGGSFTVEDANTIIGLSVFL